jgi:hypothetical protein
MDRPDPRSNETPARRDAPEDRPLLDRILDVPHLSQVVPHLQPELLHRVIQSCGLEDCSEIVALATPTQLTRVFDMDLWRAGQPGVDEQFDAERFGVWLEVLVEAGAEVAARKLAEMDAELVIAGLGQHVRVFGPAAARSYTTLDGDEIAGFRGLDAGLSCEVGGYLLVARRSESWDAIVAVLMALGEEHPDCFHDVIAGCPALSNSRPEIDGLDELLGEPEQVMFDLAFDRERRREQQGYVTPAQARAFLQMSRQVETGPDKPAPNPVARAYFRSMDEASDEDVPAKADSETAESDGPSVPGPDAASGVADVVGILNRAGLLPQQPRALLKGLEDDQSRLGRLHAHMQALFDTDPSLFAAKSGELTYLANTIMAGCSIQARSFTAQEASDAATACCNLGLENWPAHWSPATGLHDQDLLSLFQLGWTLLYNDVCMYAAGHLVGVLARLRINDRETQSALDDLRVDMLKHWQAGAPWRARDAMDVLAILDTPAWAAMLGLIDECPVMHAAIGAIGGATTRSIDASAFAFISENRQIARAHEFMEALADTLRG